MVGKANQLIGICNLANKSSYLADTITCAKKTCDDFQSSDVDRFLSPIEFTCSLTFEGIKQSRLNAAQAAAEAPVQNSGSGSKHSSTSAKPMTTAAPSTLQTTLRATTTNSKGSTVAVDQPVQYGPSGVSSGARSTIVLTSSVNVVPVPASEASSSMPDGGSTTTAGGLVVATGNPSPSGSDTTTTTSSSSTPTSSSQGGGSGSLFDSTGGAESLVSSKSSAALAAQFAVLLVFGFAL